ncbi:hypothetical protein ACIQPS_32945 [Streptomyces sp. NPDC091290]|uniref:hypothetical protein n=1 Tax=Streptomyces sp. NPDC091290 TaxID=3365990 RepID=UPI00380C41BD
MIDQLIEAAPHGPELLWDLFIALVFTLVGVLLAERLKTARRVPGAVMAWVKGLDATKPAVMFAIMFLAVVVALTTAHLVGAL